MLDVDLVAERGRFRLEARFRAPTPGVTALFGPSGAGKSTLVHALAGLIAARGRIALGAECWLDSARGLAVPAERRGIGYVFQDARLFPHLSVAGNLRYGARRARAATPVVREDEVVALLGLGALLARRTAHLSGGERQRVALGRALLSQPRLLLLDEPLAAIDGARRDEVLPYLERLRDALAIPMLYVSHQYDEVLRLATEVVLVAGGRTVAAGTPAALSLDPRLRPVVGGDAIGAVLEAEVGPLDPASGLASVAIGAGRLRLALPGAKPGDRLRLQILARDVILATEAPRGLSVRNALEGRLEELVPEGPDEMLAVIELGGPRVLARITRAAADELRLRPGLGVWALVKAASLRGHAYTRHA
ncbi:MAG: molybdenum ABC transporter ATP-binding protein [Proteobacteria bacterium]|nr:molybdenum ABC transporter ATP-binding protein [Pseudomonadota bacterium]